MSRATSLQASIEGPTVGTTRGQSSLDKGFRPEGSEPPGLDQRPDMPVASLQLLTGSWNVDLMFRREAALSLDDPPLTSPVRVRSSIHRRDHDTDPWRTTCQPKTGSGVARRPDRGRPSHIRRSVPKPRGGTAGCDCVRRDSRRRQATATARARPSSRDRAHVGRRCLQSPACGIAARDETGRGHVGRPSSSA